jgi:hypothetical protein
VETRRLISGWSALFVMMIGVAAAQQPAAPGRQGGAGAAPGRVPAPATPAMFFSEAWKQRPDGAQHPVTPEVVSSANLELQLYGASAKEVLVTGNNTAPGGVVWLSTGSRPRQSR